MSTSTEAHHTDTIRINLPVVGVAADEPNGSLQILQRPGMWPFLATAWNAVLKDKGFDAKRIQPGRDFRSFFVPSKLEKTLAKDEDGVYATIAPNECSEGEWEFTFVETLKVEQEDEAEAGASA